MILIYTYTYICIHVYRLKFILFYFILHNIKNFFTKNIGFVTHVYYPRVYQIYS